MKQSPLDTDELLNKLVKSASWWRRFFDSTSAEEINNIISDLSPLDLAVLDQRVREYGSYTYRCYALQNWHDLSPAGVWHLAQSKFAASLVGLASFHYSGYVREAAVKKLAEQRTGKELPFLLIRLNDWVLQVRDYAKKAVRARVEPAYAVHFLANIGLVFRLRNCGRVDKQFVDEICNLLKCPECKEVLQAGMASKDKLIRRVSFRLAAEADPSTRMAIIQAVMTDLDATIRFWAVRHFLPDVTPNELPSIVEPMLKDRFMPVRRDALWALATKRPELAEQPLRRALLDNHISMRETARQFLAVANVKDARVFYINIMEHGEKTQRFAAIYGLGETGLPSDVKLLTPFFNSTATNLRRASVNAMGKLDTEGQLEKLVGFLSDEKPGVSREALKTLLPKARRISLVELENLLASSANFHVRRNALTLISHADKWVKIPALLTACADNDSRIAEQASMVLRHWPLKHARNFVAPTREDYERIQSILNKVKTKLPRGFADELQSNLKIYFK